MSGEAATYTKPTYAQNPAARGPFGLNTLGNIVGEPIPGSLPTDLLKLTNAESVALPICSPVYLYASGQMKKARANAAGTTRTIGLVKTASVAAAADGQVQIEGVFTATTAQWDAVTGGSGGLTPGSVYYTSAATAGRITATAPSTSTQYVQEVGVAISATQLRLNPGTPVVIS